MHHHTVLKIQSADPNKMDWDNAVADSDVVIIHDDNTPRTDWKPVVLDH